MTTPSATGSPRLRRASRTVLVPVVAVLLAWTLVPAGPGPAALAVLLNLVALLALVAGVRQHRPVARPAWLVLVGAQVCSVLAFSYWYLLPSFTGAVVPLPSPADVLFLALYTGECVAVALLIRSEGRGADRGTLLDVLIMTASLGVLSWVFLMQPYVQDTETSTAVKLISVAYPALDLLLVVLLLRLTFSGSRTTRAKALLVAWACLQLVGDTAYGVLQLRGDWSMASPVFLLWMAAFGCLAAAALDPSMADLGRPSRTVDRGPGQARRLLVGAAVLVLPAVLMVRLVGGEVEDLGVITVASLVVFVLALVRVHGVGGGRTTRADVVALLKLAAVFVVVALLPLALLTGSSIHLSRQAVENDAQARVRATATVSAELVQEQMNGLGQLVGAYAERRLLADAYGDGRIETFDEVVVQGHLDQLMEADPGIVGVFATDARGRLTAVQPGTPEIVGRDFSYRDWYRGATTTRRPYVSEAYTTAIEGEARVVAVASVVRRPGTGEVVGILAMAYDLEAVREFSEELADAQGVTLRVTDQRGTVVAAPDVGATQLLDVSGVAGVAAALRGRESLDTTSDGGSTVLAAYAPVADLGWTVTARVPTATAYASQAPLRATVLAIAVLLGQVLLGGLVLIARGQRSARQAERALLEREEATRGILEAAADAFVSIDATDVVTAWSAQAQALFGWTSEQACGSALAELIVPPLLREAHTAGLARLAASGTPRLLGQRLELTAMHRDGHELPVELVLWRSQAAGAVSFNAFLHDISERKRHEAQLESAHEEALEASRAKSEFLAVMSHELRTPMNGVMGMTSLLLGTTLSAQQRDYAETVRTSADSLLGLLNDVLDLSKVEADKLELEVLDFDLHPVVRDVVHLMGPGARDKGIVLTADIDDDVRLALRGDPGRLRQVLLNLVGNAVKFTGTGSVRLRVRVAPRSGPDGETAADTSHRLRFEVTDTGIGIPPQARDTLFEAFSQADASTTRTYGGTGLGLAICRSLVSLFGGEIGVDSEVGVGSTFWFTARFLEGSPTLDVQQTYVPKPPPVTPGLVLVVDDNATNQKIAVRMLETLGHRADVAASGLEAVRACAQVPYDLLLMDCRMPVMDGYEATRTIRAGEGAGHRLPIVAMTASAMAEDRQRCLDAGMDDFLTKPVRVQDLAAMVDRWLHQGRTPPAGGGLVPRQDRTGDRAPVLAEDVVAGLRTLGPDFLARLVPVFHLDAPDRLAAVQAAVRAGDADQLSAAAHSLRGSAANLGGTRVAAVCRVLEESALAGRLDGAPADVLLLEGELEAMLAATAALTRTPG